MAEKNISLRDFNAKIVLKRIEKKKALCPSCERRIKHAGNLNIFKNKNTNEVLYYLTCRKCEYKKDKQTKEKQKETMLVIEKRLIENRYPYSCEVVDDPNIERMLDNVVHGNQKMQMNVFEETLGVWHKEDEQFFEDNPDRKFYARPLYKGELEAVHKGDEKMVEVAIKNNISFTMIHRVAKTQRAYEYVSDLTGHPYNEEAFVAALFMIKVNNAFGVEDLPELYQKIKENKQIVEDFKLDKFSK